MTESKEFSLIVKQIEGRCRHFNGIMSKVCDAGINYRELVGEPELDMALRLPCTNIKLKPRLGVTPQQQVKCALLDRITHAEAEAEAKDMLERSGKTMRAIQIAHRDADSKKLGRGHGGASSMPCPNGCGGTLQYSVAGYNGHMHARCTTPVCLSWM